jgi:putative phosphoesterase
MKLGIISDTHGFLDSRVVEIFKGVDHILHAGDLGPHELLIALQVIAPVTAVLGNTDMFIDLKLTELAELGGRKFLLHHIVDPLELSASLKMEIRESKPDVVIFGHTHRRFYGHQDGTMFLNPGYAGKPKPNQDRSVAILDTAAKDLCAEFFNL